MVQNFRVFFYLRFFPKHCFWMEIVGNYFKLLSKQLFWSLYQRQSFPRLRANGLFHGLFGWNGLLRISFFSSEMTMNWEKSFETCFAYFTSLSKQLTTIKCFQTSFIFFFKNDQLFVIFWTKPDNNHYLILPKKSWNRPFADSLGKLWYDLTLYLLPLQTSLCAGLTKKWCMAWPTVR